MKGYNPFIVSIFVGNLCKINAISSEEAQVLLYSNLDKPINLKNIFFATVLIGALGAVMDVSMSISSSMSEIKEANRNISTAKLMKSGMNIWSIGLIFTIPFTVIISGLLDR